MKRYSTTPFILSAMLLNMVLYPVLHAQEQSATAPISIDRLLQQVKQGRLDEMAENMKREQVFIAEKAEQLERIKQAKIEIAALEEHSMALETRFSANELLVEEKRAQRDERLGSLKELFGHLTAAAGDLRSRFRNSITTSQFVDREEFLSGLIKKMNDDTDLPTIGEIERVWYEIHREITESGKVTKYSTKVGTDDSLEVVRIGLFNLIADGNYLAYDAGTRSVSVLPRQPANLADGARALQASSVGQVIAVGIDPTGAAGGGFLKAIINTPTLEERWRQGRQVGYIITAIGICALLISLWRFIVLSLLSFKINRQLKQQEISTNNPLGRILKVADDNVDSTVDSIALKLDEAILLESPKINAQLSIIKLIAQVATLLGLLGTVTGMIIVFQAITIYGAGDPKAMAGGISSALVTTVLGLVVAIPTLLLHTVLSDKAKGLLQILSQQAAGIAAQRAGH